MIQQTCLVANPLLLSNPPIPVSFAVSDSLQRPERRSLFRFAIAPLDRTKTLREPDLVIQT